MEVWVLRLGHRIKRDERISTHCGLVARAFGANGIIYSGEKDEGLLDSIKKIVERFGGPFEVKYEKNWKKVIKAWKKRGEIIHLTVYGLPVQNVIEKIRNSPKDKLIIIGGAKVPGEIYNLANWNIAITSQPHSEVAALAIFLNKLFEGKEKKFKGKVKIIPQERGKKVLKL